MSTTKRFTDETPVAVIFATDSGALAALTDNPLILQEDDPSTPFANAVRRGVRHLRAARDADREALVTVVAKAIFDGIGLADEDDVVAPEDDDQYREAARHVLAALDDQHAPAGEGS
jgi:hypothetical protein